MKPLFPILLLSIFALGFFGIAAAAERPRVFVLTEDALIAYGEG